jgi:hypothetical protein
MNKKYARIGGEFYNSEVIQTKKLISINVNSFKNKDAATELEEKITTKLKNVMFCSKFRQKSIGMIDVELDTIKNNLVSVKVAINVLEKDKPRLQENKKINSRTPYITYQPGDNYDAYTAPNSLDYVVPFNISKTYGSSVYFTELQPFWWTATSVPFYGSIWNFACGGQENTPCIPAYFDENGNPTQAYNDIYNLDHNEMNGYRMAFEGILPSQNFGQKKFAFMSTFLAGTACGLECGQFQLWMGNFYYGIPHPIQGGPGPVDPEPCNCSWY